MRTSPLAFLTGAFLALSSPLAYGTTIDVPNDEPTIQAGIYAASSGDTVLVACGTYYEANVWLKGGVVLRSETGEPGCVTVDARELDGLFMCYHIEDAAIEGLTITRGIIEGGGGLRCYGSSVTIRSCIFHAAEVTMGHHDAGVRRGSEGLR